MSAANRTRELRTLGSRVLRITASRDYAVAHIENLQIIETINTNNLFPALKSTFNRCASIPLVS